MKLKIDIDEEWPVFTLDEPKNENERFVVDLDEQFYKEYLWIMYKYHEFQTRIKELYEQQQRFLADQRRYRFPEGTQVDEQTFNTINTVDAS